MGSNSRKKRREETSSSSPSGSDESESSMERRNRRRKEKNRRSEESSKREKERRRKRKERKERERDRKRRKSRKKRNYSSQSEDESSSESDRFEKLRVKPEDVVKEMLREFPSVGGDLKQLLQMIDSGQAVDIKGISENSLIKHLRKLFISLKLKDSGDKVFLLPPRAPPTLDIVGPLIEAHMEPKQPPINHSGLSNANDVHAVSAAEEENRQPKDDNNLEVPSPTNDVSGPARRVIGPQMPSAELLAAAAKLTEAQAELKEAELEEDTELFIGPPPPAIVAEAGSANEAERFEEVTRIMSVEDNSPYDIIGVNHSMSADNVKKRYWKLSLLVHPDKCAHPQAHQAFVKLNKAFKEIQDPDKRKLLDEKIKQKEEQEKLKVELQAMREAAQWRRSQGISMEGDDELLAQFEVKEPPKREEWMTTLPPERKPGGMPRHSTTFSKSTKEGRGDTSAWTDTPSDRAQKAKMNYLEAYNEASALASNEEEKKRANADADLVDKYNKAKRSKSLVQKHQEEAAAATRSKKKQKQHQQQPAEKQEWEVKHPWKPWDREKDLVAGRKSVKLDSDGMAAGLSSKFSSGTFQRNFL